MDVRTRIRITRSRQVLLPLLMIVLGCLTPALEGTPLDLVPLEVMLAALLVGGFFLLARLAKGGREANVRIEASGMTVDGVALPPIDQAYMVPATAKAPVRVTIGGKGFSAQLDVRDEAEAGDVLRCLGKDIDHHAARFIGVAPLKSRNGAALLGGLGIGIALIAAGIPLGMTLLTVLGIVIAIAAGIAFTANDIHIGSDGVLVKNRLDSQFYAYRDVVGAIATNRGVRLRLRERDVDIPISARVALTPGEKETRDAMLARLLAGIARAREGDATERGAEVAWRLDRGARPLAEWLRWLHDADDFRNARATNEDLESALEVDAAPWQRLGAAILLARRDDRAKIRIAAEATAAPKLRVALEKIADGVEDSALQEALADVEQEEQNTL